MENASPRATSFEQSIQAQSVSINPLVFVQCRILSAVPSDINASEISTDFFTKNFIKRPLALRKVREDIYGVVCSII